LSVCGAKDQNSPISQQVAVDAPAAADALAVPCLWDFGQIKQGEIVAHDFTLNNDSEKVLNIKNTNTSCGCTVSEVSKKVLSPGESTKISVKFNSKKYNGPVQQFVYVNTDKELDPIIRLTIKADVIK